MGAQRMEAQKIEAQRIEAQRLEAQRIEAQRQEQIRFEQQQASAAQASSAQTAQLIAQVEQALQGSIMQAVEAALFQSSIQNSFNSQSSLSSSSGQASAGLQISAVTAETDYSALVQEIIIKLTPTIRETVQQALSQQISISGGSSSFSSSSQAVSSQSSSVSQQSLVSQIIAIL